MNVSADVVRVSIVGLPGSGGGGQVSVSKTASTIVRNSNAEASAADYANGSVSPFKTISADADVSLVHATTADPSTNMTGETYHKCYTTLLYLHTPTTVAIMYRNAKLNAHCVAVPTPLPPPPKDSEFRVYPSTEIKIVFHHLGTRDLE